MLYTGAVRKTRCRKETINIHMGIIVTPIENIEWYDHVQWMIEERERGDTE